MIVIIIIIKDTSIGYYVHIYIQTHIHTFTFAHINQIKGEERETVYQKLNYNTSRNKTKND